MKLLSAILWILGLFHLSASPPVSDDVCVVHWKSVEYNELARQARFQGDVRLGVSVDPKGSVSKVVVVQSNAGKLLQDEAVKNVKEWTFNSGGERNVVIVYEFRLVMPEVHYTPTPHITADFPNRVHVETNFKTIDSNKSR